MSIVDYLLLDISIIFYRLNSEVNSLCNTKYRVYLYELGVESVFTFMHSSLLCAKSVSNLRQIPQGPFSHIILIIVTYKYLTILIT